MARVSKAPDVRRRELLENARRLFLERGYDQTPVQAVTDATGVAKGTFYHYFDSKEDLLVQLAAAQVEELALGLEERLPEVKGGAVEKLRFLFSHIIDWKSEQRDLMITYTRMMYREENLLLRYTINVASIARMMPLFAGVIVEGVNEGVFSVDYPLESAEILLSLGHFREHMARKMLSLDEDPGACDEIVRMLKAFETATERILGVADGSLNLYDYDRVRAFLLGGDEKATDRDRSVPE